MQNFITIFHSVQGIGPFSLFQNLELDKASTDKNVSLQSLGLDLVNINVYTKVYQNILLSSRDRANFHFFRIWHPAKPRPMINVILQFLGLDLFNIKLSAKFYQTIPNGLRVKFHFFQNFNLGKTSTNSKCHLTISWATSCQYQCACKISSQYQGLIWAARLRHRRALFTYGALKKCLIAVLGLSLLIRRIISSRVRRSRRVNQNKTECRKQAQPAILPKAFCNDASDWLIL